MKRISVALLLMLLSSTAHARGYSFSIGGHFIHVEAGRHCRSLSCVFWSDSRPRRAYDDEVATPVPAMPVAAMPACPPAAAPTAVAPETAAPPSAPAQVAPAAPVPAPVKVQVAPPHARAALGRSGDLARSAGRAEVLKQWSDSNIRIALQRALLRM